MEDYDFGGWATRSNVRCSDGRIISSNAFKHCDGIKVPLIWNHKHDSVLDVLGNAILQHRDSGIYAFCKFNDTDAGQEAKKMVKNGDLTALSIYANRIKETPEREVMHGDIREVSLVLAGANPGAFIDCIMAHSENDAYDAYIFNDMEELSIAHSDDLNVDKEDNMKDKTIQDVIDSMTDEQKSVLEYLVEEALNSEDENDENENGGNNDMKHNLFDGEEMQQNNVLTHSEEATMFAEGKRLGSLREGVLAHSAEYGIDNIDWLMPEYQNITERPGFVKRQPDGWVDIVMKGVHHTPFAKIKMMFADLREDSARAKGYAQKGKLKKEEVFGLIKRVVGPTTVYKKQKFDRDDIIDITSFDVVAWVKAEMRMMLDEELARAFLFGDGRSVSSDDKIKEECIIPIAKDDNFYAIKSKITPASGESFSHAFITAAVKGQDDYEGGGNTILFTANTYITDMLLMEDKDGHRLYKDVSDLALAMSVNRIVKVPKTILPAGIAGLIVDLNDYNVGADKGGAINMFDDFDIDYNQMKYLIETRCSGALVKPFSAVVLTVETESAAG